MLDVAWVLIKIFKVSPGFPPLVRLTYKLIEALVFTAVGRITVQKGLAGVKVTVAFPFNTLKVADERLIIFGAT